ncbi:hypothetical protein ALT717_320008 [Alteromonas macleodii]
MTLTLVQSFLLVSYASNVTCYVAIVSQYYMPQLRKAKLHTSKLGRLRKKTTSCLPIINLKLIGESYERIKVLQPAG